MKKILISTLLMALVANIAQAAAIDFNQVRFIKRLNASPTYPIDLYQSTLPAHGNRFFTARTLFHLGPDNTLSDYEQKKLRNEICASDKLYTAAGNAGVEDIPGSLGVYLVNDSFVSVARLGMAGERLDAVLRKLAKADDVTKTAAASYYATAMALALGSIHAGDIVWGNLDLHNFFVRPDGGVYAVDLSDAKSAPAGVGGDAVRNAEAQDLARRVIKEMYSILFQAPNQAFASYKALINAVPPNLDLATLLGALPGLGVNVPYILDYVQNLPIQKADHDNVAANQMRVEGANLNAILRNPDGTQFNNKAAYCQGWTGNE